MAQQTAVQWLIDQVEDFIGLIPTDIIHKAKQMEKEQIMDAVSYGDCRGRITTYLTDEQYYDETYGKP